MSTNTPVLQTDRIDSIDVLRGCALLGILVMNLPSMAMVGAAYSNPTLFGDFEGLNFAAWWTGHLFFDSKMMSIFSMLFGAGILLMSERAIAKTGKAAGIHYRRMFWLLLFGLAHAHLIWFGDILFCYAICGMVLYPIRRWNSVVLSVIGLIMLIIPSILNALLHWLFTDFIDDPEVIAEMTAMWSPTQQQMQPEIDAYRGGWLSQMEYRVPFAFMFETKLLGIWAFWRASGLMLIGMVLYRSGVLSAQKSKRFYATTAILCLPIGFAVIQYGVHRMFETNWGFPDSMFQIIQFNYWASILVALGYVSIVMLLLRYNVLPNRLRLAIAAVGQMALTNYLMHSILGTWIFYGHGLGYFGYVDRAAILAIVLGIWAFQLVMSPWWLARFRFGPAEWIWRSLTYWKRQPFRRPPNGALA